MTGQALQTTILQHIRALIPKEKNVATELATALGLGVNAAYKRLEGKTALTVEDLARIAEYFNLPWQRIFHPENEAVSIEFSGFAARKSSLEYLQLMEHELAKLLKSASCSIKFLTVGLPDFHLFQMEELALFQFYFWERMAWGDPEMQEKKFSLKPYNAQEITAQTKRIVNHYMRLESIEIWNEHVLDSFLHQLIYVYESRLFENPSDKDLICEKLLNLIDHMERMAKHERRYPVGGVPSEGAAQWQLYSNEVMRNNIILLVKTAETEFFFAVMNNPHFIKSTDERLVEYASSHFEKQLQRAYPLGKNGEKERGTFFEKLREKVRLQMG